MTERGKEPGAPPTESSYRLSLFTVGATTRSARAIANIHAFCEQELTGDYELEVIDLYESPERAQLAQIVAAPTLIRSEPKPARRIIGDLSDRGRLLKVIKVA